MRVRTLKLTIEYDGTEYGGWQRQPNATTVQEVLEDALEDLTGERSPCTAAGRTDSGVHAEAQVVSLRTRSLIPADGIRGAVNARLPEDVAVISAEEAAPEFHARRDAVGKHYRYRIVNRRVAAPLSRRFAHRVSAPLDDRLMARAAAFLTGRHDFSSFRNAGSFEGHAVRTLRRLDIARAGEYISISAVGDGFLYKMVRNLVGTLILVGRGALSPGEVGEILEARDRRRAGPTAAAQGLSLVEVFY